MLPASQSPLPTNLDRRYTDNGSRFQADSPARLGIQAGAAGSRGVDRRQREVHLQMDERHVPSGRHPPLQAHAACGLVIQTRPPVGWPFYYQLSGTAATLTFTVTGCAGWIEDKPLPIFVFSRKEVMIAARVAESTFSPCSCFE